MVDNISFYFCKKKTAYELRISDWSSDVCSSDLGGVEEEESGRESCHYRLSGAHGADFYGLGRVRGEHVLEVGPAGRQRSVEGQLRVCRLLSELRDGDEFTTGHDLGR